MLAFTALLVLAVHLGPVLGSPVLQVALQASNQKPRGLHGRFLQITDMHPDPYYAPRSSEKTSCHRKKGKKANNQAGLYGTPYSDCDSPFKLTNLTFNFLDKKWASEVDFVIWTGDNARHDNDPKLPRTPDEIYNLNREVASRMKEVFTSRGIPVVPSLGNNDVWRPNGITNEFSQIWSTFIPFPYLQVFQRGAYYSVEVIPNEVAAISLNTMYFYDSNKAVGGCPFKNRDDPGNLQLDWLEVQLKLYRDRNMQVWITGHVPPSPGNYFPDCYTRYAELSLRFQDTVLGHLFGHMNADHFGFVEAIDLEFTPDETETDKDKKKHVTLYDELLEEYSTIPTKAKDLDFAEYAVINVAPPVVPNPYLPSFRIFSYNVSGTDGARRAPKTTGKRRHGHKRGEHGNREALCKLKKNRETWKCFLNETWYSDPGAPSRSNQQYTPLGYAQVCHARTDKVRALICRVQYYIPNRELTGANKTHRPRFKLEYLTFVPSMLHPDDQDATSEFHYPIPLQHLPRSLREPGVTKSRYAPYELVDLTIPSWVGLAQRLGDSTQRQLRRRFRKYMYMGGEEG
ncbi:hypothetical protein DXG03_009304 [Asterophora parasitica]|uniref:Calcineurin-like phosphoesterase domain-containing protein n=1 Tax=Asterophora parasitica TaxID=117018 RepID=A0A9P7G873_9AGAR|nr:hypothetical protein DXG03_009304 [Asterophora parasitica]